MRKELVGCSLPPFVGTSEEADGPVGAEHAALRAEAFDGVLDIRLQIGDPPGVPVSFGNQAGDFAVQVGKLRGGSELPLPAVDFRWKQL